MPLIPSDVGLRLRLDNELQQTQQTAPVKEITADLPRLQSGQLFTAQIRDVLPQNTYLALVGGKQVTLKLPENVKSGDVLELVVVEQTAKTIIATRADASSTAGQTTPSTTLSTTGQMLRSLLLNEGETPQSAPLNRGQPLLPNPPQSGADLAPALQKAVTQSGLFYEAHQAQWVTGKLSLASLRQEPQGQIPTTTQQPGSPAQAQTSSPATLLAQASAPPLPQTATPTQMNNAVLQSLLLYQNNQSQSPETRAVTGKGKGKDSNTTTSSIASALLDAHDSDTATHAAGSGTASSSSSADTAQNATKSMPALPDDLRALVQQQLDAAGTQRLLWHGEIWPGQTMSWQLEWQDSGGAQSEAQEAEPWQTTLRMTTPRLGSFDATLHLGASGVRVALNVADPESVARMREQAVDLDAALAAAGVPLQGFSIKQTPPDEDA